MPRLSAALPLLCLLALLVTPAPAARALEPDCESGARLWSQTEPPLDLTHLFCGERDPRDGGLEGYHALAGVRTPGEAAIRERYAGPNADGVSRAVVCAADAAAGGAKASCKCSSLFPDDWSVERVVAAVLSALERGRADGRGFFRGPGGAGFAVEGWLILGARARRACGAERCVATAWPAFEADADGRALPWHCPLEPD